MIFRHYRRWIPGLQTGAGKRVANLLDTKMGAQNPSVVSPDLSPSQKKKEKIPLLTGLSLVEAGGIEPPSEGLPATATTRLVCEF